MSKEDWAKFDQESYIAKCKESIPSDAVIKGAIEYDLTWKDSVERKGVFKYVDKENRLRTVTTKNNVERSEQGKESEANMSVPFVGKKRAISTMATDLSGGAEKTVDVPSFFVIETPHDYYWNLEGADFEVPHTLGSFLSQGILEGTLAPKLVGYDSTNNIIHDDPDSLQQQMMISNPIVRMIIEMKNPYLKALYIFIGVYNIILLTGSFYPPECKIHQLSEILFKPFDYIIDVTTIKEEKEADPKKKD